MVDPCQAPPRDVSVTGVRESAHLRQRYRAMLGAVGLVALVVGVLLLVPPLATIGSGATPALLLCFVVSGVLSVAVGYAAWTRMDARDVVFTLQEGGVIVLLSWILACVLGALPFLVEGATVTQAVFESVSGWTTTGLSVVDVVHASPALLLWRSTMQLAGGAGLAVIMLAALTSPGGASLSAAEGRDHLVPNVRASASLVLKIYAGYVLFGVPALRIAGMSWLDAVNHTFAAVSTGGFSTQPDSIGHWNSPAIELVTLLLMVLGNLNFVTAWTMLRGRWRAVARNGEIRVMALLIPTAFASVLWLTCLPLYASVPKACRVALFETVSALTTTGYSTVGYADWNAFGVLMLIVLMLVGSGACSTGGALKQYRVHVLWRCVVRELRQPFLPRTAVVDDSIWQGDRRVALNDGRVRTVSAFTFLYLLTWLLGTAVLTACGYGVRASLFEFASALGTVGLSVGVTSADASPTVLWTETAGMLLGRLEFFVVLTSAARIVVDLGQITRRGP